MIPVALRRRLFLLFFVLNQPRFAYGCGIVAMGAARCNCNSFASLVVPLADRFVAMGHTAGGSGEVSCGCGNAPAELLVATSDWHWQPSGTSPGQFHSPWPHVSKRGAAACPPVVSVVLLSDLEGTLQSEQRDRFGRARAHSGLDSTAASICHHLNSASAFLSMELIPRCQAGTADRRVIMGRAKMTSDPKVHPRNFNNFRSGRPVIHTGH